MPNLDSRLFITLFFEKRFSCWSFPWPFSHFAKRCSCPNSPSFMEMKFCWVIAWIKPFASGNKARRSSWQDAETAAKEHGFWEQEDSDSDPTGWSVIGPTVEARNPLDHHLRCIKPLGFTNEINYQPWFNWYIFGEFYNQVFSVPRTQKVACLGATWPGSHGAWVIFGYVKTWRWTWSLGAPNWFKWEYLVKRFMVF